MPNLTFLALPLEIFDSILLKRAILQGALAKYVKLGKILPSFYLVWKILGKKLCKHAGFPGKKFPCKKMSLFAIIELWILMLRNLIFGYCHSSIGTRCRWNFTSTFTTVHKMSKEFFVDIVLQPFLCGRKFLSKFCACLQNVAGIFHRHFASSVKCRWNFPSTFCSCHFHVDKNFCRHPIDIAKRRRKIPSTCYGQKQNVIVSKMWAPVTLSPLK